MIQLIYFDKRSTSNDKIVKFMFHARSFQEFVQFYISTQNRIDLKHIRLHIKMLDYFLTRYFHFMTDFSYTIA